MMSSRPNAVSTGESGRKVLCQLRRERSIAIENLSSSKPRSADSTHRTRSASSVRLPPLSPVPRLLINSMDIEEDGVPTAETDSDDAFYTSAHEIDDTYLQNLIEMEDLVEVNRRASTQRRGSSPSRLSIPDSPLSRSGSFEKLGDISCYPPSSDRKLMDIPSQGRLAGRSRSPSPHRTVLNPTKVQTPPKKAQLMTGLSPGTPPILSPSLPRRRSSLTLPSSAASSRDASPNARGLARGAPTNTQGRLMSRSASYKLQKFLDETKSQLTMAQKLELHAANEVVANEGNMPAPSGPSTQP